MTVLFLDLSDVLDIHASRIEMYGGSAGVRDLGLLQSAIAQPQASFGEEYLHKTLFEMAAAYLFHIACNHPFIDGNKRSALACALVFLDLNGVEIVADAEELEELIVAVGSGKADKVRIAEFFALTKNHVMKK